jgi:hydroxymethylpyrimidine pyrophosphatase-like HAD family hydrolase
VPLGADKASAARLLLARWGLRPEEAVAIGDGENDVTLLRLCGRSAAMGNGAAAARVAAQHVVGTNGAEGWSEVSDKCCFYTPIQ